MRLLRSSFLPLFVLCLAGLVSVLPSAAQGSPTFTGFYQLGDATDNADGTTTVSLSVMVFNYYANDAVNATVTLGDSVNPIVIYGSFDPTTITSGGYASLTGQFIVSSDEYANWVQNGAAPNLSVHVADTNNSPQVEGVPLTQSQVGSN
jgi:hypothetical protein